ncbi:MAG: HlyD family efflux transporter periplasmic adaptor subunit [Pseudomonadota bacterium]
MKSTRMQLGGALGTLLRVIIFLAICAGLGAGAFAWWEDREQHVYVYDARLAADMVTLSAARDGHLTTLTVSTGDHLPGDTVVARQDTRELDLRVAEIDDEIAETGAERARIVSQRTLVAARNVAAIATANARLSVAAAELRALEVRQSRARADLARAERLYKSRVISSQEVETARTDLDGAEERAAQAAAAVVEAKAELGATRAEEGRLDVLDAEAAVLEVAITRLKTRRERLLAERADAEISVAFDAVVARTFVEAGEYLKAGTRVALVHDPAAVWVEANVKETELHRFKPGSTVTLTVDALPERNFTGTVRWLGSTATSQFALLPNPNPSGNFTKVTQRVPVRIDFDDAPVGLRPGTMVVAKIHVAQR